MFDFYKGVSLFPYQESSWIRGFPTKSQVLINSVLTKFVFLCRADSHNRFIQRHMAAEQASNVIPWEFLWPLWTSNISLFAVCLSGLARSHKYPPNTHCSRVNSHKENGSHSRPASKLRLKGEGKKKILKSFSVTPIVLFWCPFP